MVDKQVLRREGHGSVTYRPTDETTTYNYQLTIRDIIVHREVTLREMAR